MEIKLETKLDIKDYSNRRFDFKTWNCLHFAKHLHDDYFGVPNDFPEIIDKFALVEECDASEMIKRWIPIYCRRVTKLSNGCLVVLISDGNYNLASYYDGLVYYMGNKSAVAHPPPKLSSFIASIWEIKK